jgi:DNA-directed RNA polymerase specialized sigma24 family protein
VARNLLLKQAGAGRRRRLLTNRIAALTSAADHAAWDAGKHVVEREVALAALASLPDLDVEALSLITWHGLTIAEAAAVAGCSARAFTVRLYRAQRRLSEVLQSADQMTEPLRCPHACRHKTGRSIPPIDHISRGKWT